jgi:PAS domain S-box-containing protein
MESHFSPIIDDAGELAGMRGVTLDITQRKLAEDALYQSQEKTRDILRAIPDLMLLQSADGVYLECYAGQPHEMLLPHSALIGKNMRDVLPLELSDEFFRSFNRAQATGETQLIEYPLSVDGEERWFEARIVASNNNILSIVRNITNHKRAEQEVRTSRMQLAGIIDSAMDAIVSIDEDRRIVLFNTAAEQMFGCDASQAIGQSLDQFIPERFREKHRRGLEAFGATAATQRSMGTIGQLYGLRADGTEFPIEGSISRVEFNGSRLCTAILRDITDRIRAEKAVKESEANYRSIFNAVNDAIFVHDTESGQIVDVNQVMCHMYGVTQAEARTLGVDVLSSNEPPYTQKEAIAWIKKAAAGEPQLFEWRARDKSGRLFWAEVSLSPSIIGGKHRVLAVVRDITYRKQSEDALRESEARFRVMADTAPVMIWISGIDKGCTYFNQQWLNFTGRRIEEELGNGWTTGIHPDDYEHCIDTYSASFDLKEPFTMEYRLRRADGEYRWILDSGTPRFSAGGKFLGYVGSCVDITERKTAEQALADFSGELIRARENECARIARELHDDLNQRMALISVELEQLLQDSTLTGDKLHEHLKEIIRQAREISREIHRMSYDLHPSKLVHLGLVAAVESLCEELGQTHGVNIEFNHEKIPSNLPEDISLCLYRIAQECLNNVVRHSGAREASVELRANRSEIRILVSDSGIGFDVDSPRIKKGLGLVSMRERLRLVGGRISIESRPSRGTHVDARVPLARKGMGQEGLSAGDKTRAAGG